jgi:hypothetical protein
MKTFTDEFEEEKRPNRITYEYSLDEDEKLCSSLEDGIPAL